jgi:hypothetical protein
MLPDFYANDNYKPFSLKCNCMPEKKTIMDYIAAAVLPQALL